MALGRLGARAVEPLLHALQHDKTADVREGAAMALGALGDARELQRPKRSSRGLELRNGFSSDSNAANTTDRGSSFAGA